MTEMTTLPLERFNRRIATENTALNAGQMKWRVTAMLGFASGFALLASGLLTSLIGRFFETGVSAAELSRVGTILLVPAFPLMFLGAHALDRLHEEKRRRAALRTAYRKVQ